MVKGEKIMAVPNGAITTSEILVPEVVPVVEEVVEEVEETEAEVEE
jgi:hypothetical protein